MITVDRLARLIGALRPASEPIPLKLAYNGGERFGRNVPPAELQTTLESLIGDPNLMGISTRLHTDNLYRFVCIRITGLDGMEVTGASADLLAALKVAQGTLAPNIAIEWPDELYWLFPCQAPMTERTRVHLQDFSRYLNEVFEEKGRAYRVDAEYMLNPSAGLPLAIAEPDIGLLLPERVNLGRIDYDPMTIGDFAARLSPLRRVIVTKEVEDRLPALVGRYMSRLPPKAQAQAAADLGVSVSESEYDAETIKAIEEAADQYETEPLAKAPDRDEYYSPAVLALRDAYFHRHTSLIPPENRRYGLMTHAMLAACRAIAGKKLIAEGADTQSIYCGTGVVLCMADSGPGKSSIITEAGRIYKEATGDEPYTDKPTMPKLIQELAFYRKCIEGVGKNEKMVANAKERMRIDTRAFLFLGDEYVRVLQRLLTNFAGNGEGMGEEDRFNLLFDDGSTVGNGTRDYSFKSHDNCNMILAAGHADAYAKRLAPFLTDDLVSSGTAARINVMFSFAGNFAANYNPDEARYWSTLAALRKLWSMGAGLYLRAKPAEGINPIVLFDELPECQRFKAAYPAIYMSFRYKRMRDAVREAMILELLERPELLAGIKEPDGFDDPPLERQCIGTFEIKTETLMRRLKSQSINMTNHILDCLTLGSQGSWAQKLKMILSARPEGLRKNEIVAGVKGQREYHDVSEALDKLVASGEIVIAKVKAKVGPARTVYRLVSHA